MKDLIIIGAGGFAREIAWLVEEINEVENKWNLLGFYDENNTSNSELNGYKILTKDEFYSKKGVYIVICIGDSETRKKVVKRYTKDYKFAILIHPSVSFSSTNRIGEGSIICKGSIITVNVVIGKHVIINLDSTIGHDAILSDYCTVLPSVNISGNVKLGECTNVGTGSAIIQNLNICKNTIIGAGSVVIKDLPEYIVAVGVPAKIIKNRKEV